ncbi:MAG TPA: AI-2E family transporter [Terriglobales bacterium]|nr:AI-2E family transporter [Terriglobales bacterium]
MNIRRSDIVFFFALVLGLYVAWLARGVLLLVYVSALFAVVISPAIRAVRKLHINGWRPSRGVAIVVVVIAGLLLLSLIVGFALPPIVRDAQGLASAWPKNMSALAERIRHVPLISHIDPASLQEHAASAVGGVFGVFKGIAGGVFWFFSWLILTAYFILDGDRAFHWFMSLFPAGTRARLKPTMIRAEGRVRHWLVGQLALMLILGLCSLGVFWALKIKYFYALAVFAGLANIVPIVGPLASVVLASVVAAFDSWPKLIGVLIFYFVYQQLENAFLTPRIMRKSVDLPALAVIIALSLGGSLAGVLGALVAVPTAALVAVFMEEYLVRPHADEVDSAAGIEEKGDATAV